MSALVSCVPVCVDGKTYLLTQTLSANSTLPTAITFQPMRLR